jgi:GTP-binding protein
MDKVRVWAIGGMGGQGSVAISRENYGSPIPDGGSGGDGGSVWFYASGRITSLHDLRRAHFKGNNGKSGKGKQLNGKNGADSKFLVPLGTEIYEIKSG